MTKVIVHGSGGMMGQAVVRLIEKNEDFTVVAGIDTSVDSVAVNFPVFKSLAECDVKADVVIDFSTSKAIDQLIKQCVDKNCPVVICTTGLSHETLENIKEASEKIAIFKSANMSLGINLLNSVLKKVSKVLYNDNFDIEIVERHHNKKIDAPSGTALLLANTIDLAIEEKLKYTYDRSEYNAKRSKNELGIHAVRGGTIVGDHTVIFAGEDEVIEFSHSAYSKEVFAMGAIKASEFIKSKPANLYSMDDMFSDI